MRQLINATAAWPSGARLALFFCLPAVIAVRAIGFLAEIPLYLEYRLTTTLRSHWGVPSPPALGEIASAIAATRPAGRRASWILIVAAVLLAWISGAAAHQQGNHFLQVCGHLIDQGWLLVVHRAGIGA
jgi:hypothetical protein